MQPNDNTQVPVILDEGIFLTSIASPVQQLLLELFELNLELYEDGQSRRQLEQKIRLKVLEIKRAIIEADEQGNRSADEPLTDILFSSHH